jgi:hypothetical protein
VDWEGRRWYWSLVLCMSVSGISVRMGMTNVARFA